MKEKESQSRIQKFLNSFKENPFWIIVFLVIVVTGFIVSGITYDPKSHNYAGLATNIGCILVMGGMICFGYFGWRFHGRGLKTLTGSVKDLRQAAERLREAAKDPQADLEALINADGEESLFRTDWLREALARHRNELDRLYREDSDFRCTDIAEYINQELLDQIGNTSFNNLISGSMTGLGILGTFMGLMFGLQDFNTETADEMMRTITPLIEGIKVAFVTSIFGVIFSIAFSIFYRRVLSDAADAVEEFQGVYYKYVLAKPDNDGFTQLLRYQKKQSDNIDQLAEHISMSMAAALGKTVIPTFEKIETSIGSLTDKIAHNQSQSIEKISEQFVQKMDESMGNQMHHLGENIQTLCQWQDTTLEKMGQTVELFVKSMEHLDTLDTSFANSVQVTERYMKTIDDMQQQLLSSFRDAQEKSGQILTEMSTQLSGASQLLEQHQKAGAEVIRSMQNSVGEFNQAQQENAEKLLTRQQETAAELLQHQQEKAEELVKRQQEAGGEIIRAQQEAGAELLKTQWENGTELVSAQKELIQTQKDTGTQLVSAQKELIQAQKDTGSQLREVQQELVQAQQETGAELRKIQQELVLGNRENTEEFIKNQQQAGAELIRVQQEAAEELLKIQKELVNGQQDKAAELAQAQSRAGEQMAQAQQEMMEAHRQLLDAQKDAAEALKKAEQETMERLKKSEELLMQQADKVSGNMQNASAHLSQASEDLSANLSKSMSHTYQEIDRQLAEIIRHLSGTLAEMRDVLDRTPRMMKDAEEQSRKSMNDYLSAVESAQKQLLTEVQNLHSQSGSRDGKAKEHKA